MIERMVIKVYGIVAVGLIFFALAYYTIERGNIAIISDTFNSLRKTYMENFC